MLDNAHRHVPAIATGEEPQIVNRDRSQGVSSRCSHSAFAWTARDRSGPLPRPEAGTCFRISSVARGSPISKTGSDILRTSRPRRFDWSSHSRPFDRTPRRLHSADGHANHANKSSARPPSQRRPRRRSQQRRPSDCCNLRGGKPAAPSSRRSAESSTSNGDLICLRASEQHGHPLRDRRDEFPDPLGFDVNCSSSPRETDRRLNKVTKSKPRSGTGFRLIKSQEPMSSHSHRGTCGTGGREADMWFCRPLKPTHRIVVLDSPLIVIGGRATRGVAGVMNGSRPLPVMRGSAPPTGAVRGVVS